MNLRTQRERALVAGCERCGACAGADCIAADGSRRWQPHPERFSAAPPFPFPITFTKETAMITCPCKFVADASIAPHSPEWHSQHKDHHLRVYPNAGERTIESLDELIAIAERKRKVDAAGKIMRDELAEVHRRPHLFVSRPPITFPIEPVRRGRRRPAEV